MYTKDLRHKMTLRLNDELKDYVEEMADKFTISPSDFIRQCITQNKDAREMTKQVLSGISGNLEKTLKEGLENGIDRKTDKHDIV